jgi:8-oxo-dGTP diphosphatase
MTNIAVVGAVISKNGKILSAQRKIESKLGGLWEFPGGKIEANETARNALRRELKEELDVEIEIGREICTIVHEYEFATIELTTFECFMLGKNIVLHEHEAVKWLGIDELESVNWAPADIPTINLLKGGGWFE